MVAWGKYNTKMSVILLELYIGSVIKYNGEMDDFNFKKYD